MSAVIAMLAREASICQAMLDKMGSCLLLVALLTSIESQFFLMFEHVSVDLRLTRFNKIAIQLPSNTFNGSGPIMVWLIDSPRVLL